ncbi:MAG: hypothetical protein KJO69_02260, partial [Gammaproteobacteria bacterium]|nr:hypothetical protein [Gammaproteobacteria bacterium]
HHRRKPMDQGGAEMSAKRSVGRPAREVPRVPLSVRVEPETAAKFRLIAQQLGISQATLLTRFVDSVKTH